MPGGVIQADDDDDDDDGGDRDSVTSVKDRTCEIGHRLREGNPGHGRWMGASWLPAPLCARAGRYGGFGKEMLCEIDERFIASEERVSQIANKIKNLLFWKDKWTDRDLGFGICEGP